MNKQAYFLDDRTFLQFRDYIYELTGISYTDGKRYLLDTRVRRRAQEVGMVDGSSYLDYLKNNPQREGEIDLLIDQVSTHETSFFRHVNQMKTFTTLVGELIKVRRAAGNRKIKIWSAACSTGEEPYTLAMIVRELLGDEIGWGITIAGTDISSGSIEEARNTHFTERNVRNVAEPYLSRYFNVNPTNPQQMRLSEEIAGMVEFQVVSLINAKQMAQFRDFDIVFCRNVLIYFDDEAKKKVVGGLWNSLTAGGHLVLGPSDSLHNISDAFQRSEYSVYNFYRKPGAPAKSVTPPKPANNQPSARALPTSSIPPPRMASPTSALSSSDLLRLKTLIQRLDRGIRDLNQDVDSSLSKIIEAVSSVADSLGSLSEEEDLAPNFRSQLRTTDRQIMRILLFLQVGDRAGQKSEALRAILQEMSDRLLGEQKEAPDLKVDTLSFDENILPEESGSAGQDGESMSQDDIDALFE
ncbi:MAG: chemotaxis protein methyltransferase CheR [Candidatus Latescibacterota bacterium]|jgi:chemotaxis protein methyltransferase CheR